MRFFLHIKTWSIISLQVLVIAFPCAAQDKNYCHDKAAEAQWQALLTKHPKEYELQALHALRIGICVKVDRGTLTLEEGTEIFEKARAALVHGWKEENLRKGMEEKKPL